MGGPRYFKIQFRLRDFFVSLVYFAVGMTFVRLAIWAPETALVAMAAASALFGAAVGALFRRAGWGALIGLLIFIWSGPIPGKGLTRIGPFPVH